MSSHIIIIIINFFLSFFSRRPENSPPIQISSGNNGVIENLSQNNKESWPSLNNGTSRNDSPGKIYILTCISRSHFKLLLTFFY